MQAGGERLLQPDEEVPGPELAAVGVTAELEVEAYDLGRIGAARLVLEQEPDAAFGLPTSAERGALSLGAVEVTGAEVGTPATTSEASPRRTTTCSFIHDHAEPRSSRTQAAAPE